MGGPCKCKSVYNRARLGRQCGNPVHGAKHICNFCYNRIRFRLDNEHDLEVGERQKMAKMKDDHETAKREYNAKGNISHKKTVAKEGKAK
mgnify:CR=1 FL=1